MQKEPDLAAQIARLDLDVEHALEAWYPVVNWLRLKDDIKRQIAGVDEVANRVDPNRVSEKQVWVRRSAIQLLRLLNGESSSLRGYKGMLSRGENAPAQPQFIALFDHADRGEVVVKTYGYRNPNEITALKAYKRAGVTGVVDLIDGGVGRETSFVVLEKLPGTSLTAHWNERDRPPRGASSVPETRQIARILRRLHEVEVSQPNDIPRLVDVLDQNARDAAQWLKDNGYGDLVRPGAVEFARTTYGGFQDDAVLLVGEPFAANVVRSPDGRLTVIDPTPRIGPRSFDAAYWISHTADPSKLSADVQAWLEEEPDLDLEEFSRCLSAELLRHAGILEVVKRETGQDWETRDPETVALINAANALALACERGHIAQPDDLVLLLGNPIAKSPEGTPGLGRALE